MMTSEHKSEYFRDQAEAARAIAERVENRVDRENWLSIAQQFERLATKAERRSQNPQN